MIVKSYLLNLQVFTSFALATAVGFILLCVNSAHAAAWNIPSLTRYESKITGPNCFNGTLLAKGYMDQMQYVDGMEFLFYMEKFCRVENKNTLAAGHVLLASGANLASLDNEQVGPVVLHSAISMGSDQLFEKATAFPGTYDIRKVSESLFYGSAGEENGTTERVSYVCPSANTVLSAIAKLNVDPIAKRINTFKVRFVKSVMEQKKGLDKREVTKEGEELTKLLANRAGRGEVDLYLVAIARSWVGTVDSYVKENKTTYDDNTTYSLTFLKEAVSDLTERIREQTKNPRIIKFLDQTDVW